MEKTAWHYNPSSTCYHPYLCSRTSLKVKCEHCLEVRIQGLWTYTMTIICQSVVSNVLYKLPIWNVKKRLAPVLPWSNGHWLLFYRNLHILFHILYIDIDTASYWMPKNMRWQYRNSRYRMTDRITALTMHMHTWIQYIIVPPQNTTHIIIIYKVTCLLAIISKIGIPGLTLSV